MVRSLRVNLTDRQLCASSTAEGIGACKGDSGGPLARRRDPDTVSIKITIISCYSLFKGMRPEVPITADRIMGHKFGAT
jgi:hypothetical protein